MLVSRRSLLRAAVAAPAFSLPRILRAQSQSTLRFIPVIDLTFVDPIYSTAQVSRNHGFMVYDTLYGMNSGLEVSPQMVSGHVVSSDDRQWDLTLRDGLLWHDGERVLARDCVASIRRWATRDGFGAELMAATDELSAPDDRTIRFRLNRPFPLLPAALGKSAIQAPFMMPERLASQDAFKPLTEVVGSGPFRFVADERVPGARNVYARFDRYQPRQDGKPDWTAGPKIVHYDRVVWTTTAVAGDDPAYQSSPIGFFAPGTPMASDVGLNVFRGPRDMAKVRADLKTAGYNGEKVVLLVPTNSLAQKPLGDVAADMLQQAGMNVEYAGLDFGVVLQRQLKKDPIAQGGWSAGVGNWQGIDWLNPAGNSNLRGDSKAPGWYKSEKMGALRSQWLVASNVADQQRICREIQALSFEEVPYFPIGQYKQPTAYRSSITGILDGTAVFWNVKPT